MKIGDVMTQPVETISVLATAEEAAEKMARRNVGALPVRSDEWLVGIITDRDLMVRCMAEGRDPASVAMWDLMTTHPIVVSPRDPLQKAVEILATHRLRRLPVVEQGRVVGIISVVDIAREVQDTEILAALVRGSSPQSPNSNPGNLQGRNR